MSLKDIDKSNIPRHVAVIMDGNGRWAKKRGLRRENGHREGRKSVVPNSFIKINGVANGLDCRWSRQRKQLHRNHSHVLDQVPSSKSSHNGNVTDSIKAKQHFLKHF